LFEWISLWENAFTNWNNSHNGYGELAEINAATIEDVRSFFKTYYAPNNAVLTIVGDVDVNEVKKMVEKYFMSIPEQPAPKRADLTEPPQTKEKRVSQTDKLANLPALATGYHLPPQHSPDFPAVALLVQVLQAGEGSRWYQRLVKEKELTLDLSGGLNYFGNEFDYTGPMIMTTRTTYKPGHTADEVLREMDAVVADITTKGITDKELANAKVQYRSNFYSQLEGSFGKAHLLSALALFRDDPQQINSLLTAFENVTAAQVKSAAAKYLVATNRTVIDRVPEKKGTNQ
jgi:zinc protease